MATSKSVKKRLKNQSGNKKSPNVLAAVFAEKISAYVEKQLSLFEKQFKKLDKLDKKINK